MRRGEMDADAVNQIGCDIQLLPAGMGMSQRFCPDDTFQTPTDFDISY
jgi:hypothetical protein